MQVDQLKAEHPDFDVQITPRGRGKNRRYIVLVSAQAQDKRTKFFGGPIYTLFANTTSAS
jgi:hypothetical protein